MKLVELYTYIMNTVHSMIRYILYNEYSLNVSLLVMLNLHIYIFYDRYIMKFVTIDMIHYMLIHNEIS